jgi:hypothetical protein
MQGFRTLMVPQNVVFNHLAASQPSNKVMATSAKETKYDVAYYTKAALAGGICCGITHGALWYV